MAFSDCHCKLITSSSLFYLFAIVVNLLMFVPRRSDVAAAAAVVVMPKNQIMKRTSNYSNVRIELFFKSIDELRERARFLSSRGVNSFNLVNKNNRDDLRLWMDVLQEEVPGCDICCHYSLKYNKSRKRDGARLKLLGFIEDQNKVAVKNDILLVSGSGVKGEFNSVSALEELQASGRVEDRVSVAFNPFLPLDVDHNDEKHRLLQKIKTGLVNKIYIQFGTDLKRLRSSLEWLREIEKNVETEMAVCGSIFLPTKKLISQQKFRPWNGVFLNENFLSSEDNAREIVLEMIQLYKSIDYEIIVEAPGIRNENDMNILDTLLFENSEFSICNEPASTDGVEVQKSLGSKHLKTEKYSNLPTSLPSPKVTKDDLTRPAILLFGSHDVRLHDNVALQLACMHTVMIPVFIWSSTEQGKWGVRGASEVLLKDALKNVNYSLKDHDLNLNFRTAENSVDELCKLCSETNAAAVYFNQEHTPEGRNYEQIRKTALANSGIVSIECQSSLLYDPTSLLIEPGFRGGHWGTLMPFMRACKNQLGEPRRPVSTTHLLNTVKGPESWPHSVSLDDIDLATINGKIKWDIPIRKRFPMSEKDAVFNLNTFFNDGFRKYEKERNRADIEWSTSKLSAHLRIGTISPNELYYKVEDSDLCNDEKKTFSRRLFWRDLAYFQLFHFPLMRDRSIRLHYDDTQWVSDTEGVRRFEAWKQGRTGYPLVDAGMRELYSTGWMTQSIRMVVASFLTEYLRVNWVKGCDWFHYTLADADSAINAMMWQNAGRSGIDQWNFVMSPVAASQDPSGDYTRRWVPELADLPTPFLHRPWEAPDKMLENAGVILGETYPHRIVTDLKREREISDGNVISMRSKNQQFNDARGYDLVRVCGEMTVVFTKKQFRIDKKGNLLKQESSTKGRSRSKKIGKRSRAKTRAR